MNLFWWLFIFIHFIFCLFSMYHVCFSLFGCRKSHKVIGIVHTVYAPIADNMRRKMCLNASYVIKNVCM